MNEITAKIAMADAMTPNTTQLGTNDFDGCGSAYLIQRGGLNFATVVVAAVVPAVSSVVVGEAVDVVSVTTLEVDERFVPGGGAGAGAGPAPSSTVRSREDFDAEATLGIAVFGAEKPMKTASSSSVLTLIGGCSPGFNSGTTTYKTFRETESTLACWPPNRTSALVVGRVRMMVTWSPGAAIRGETFSIFSSGDG
jgi:hypothetical protein